MPVQQSEIKYTETDKASFKEYQTKSGINQYYKLYDSSSPYPRLISKSTTKEPLFLSFLVDDYRKWYKEKNGGKFPPALPSADYLAAPLSLVTGIRFQPSGPDVIKLPKSRHCYINSYQSFDPIHPALPLPIEFHEFFDAFIHDRDELHIFQQYIAHMIQQPEVRPSWHIMILSFQGTGKGFLFDSILTPLLCEQTFLVKKYSDVIGQFSSTMDGSMLVYLDDCKARTDDIKDQLKSIMSEERIYVEKKGLQGGMVNTYARMILASNDDNPLSLDETQRRWWAPQRLKFGEGVGEKEGQPIRQALVKKLSDWLSRPGAMEAVYNYYATYDITDFNPKSPPHSAYLTELAEGCATVEQSFTMDFIEQSLIKVVTTADLMLAFEQAKMNKPSNNALKHLFLFCGYKKAIVEANGRGRLNYWLPQAMTPKEAAVILESTTF